MKSISSDNKVKKGNIVQTLWLQETVSLRKRYAYSFNQQPSMQKTMDYILISFTEAANILLATKQADYKSVSPELVCVNWMFVSTPLIYILKPWPSV